MSQEINLDKLEDIDWKFSPTCEYVCGDCDRFFVTRSEKEVHSPCFKKKGLIDDKTKRFICPVSGCKHTTKTIVEIHRHTRGVHFAENFYICLHCDRRCATKGSLFKHIKTAHYNSRCPYRLCESSVKDFATKGLLMQHLQEFHNVTGIQCPDCGAIVTSENGMRLHRVYTSCNKPKEMKTHGKSRTAGPSHRKATE